MSSSFQGLTIGLSALQAQQRAMEVAGQNIANVNTPGYSRQRVALAPASTQWAPSLEGFPQSLLVGSGVDLTAIQRISAGLLIRQLRSETATLRQWEAFRDSVTRVEGVLQDLGSHGLGDTLDAFWSAWRELAAAPQETAMRLTVIDRGRQLAQQFNLIYERLTELQSSLDEQIASVVEEVNDRAVQVADLNRQIRLALAMDQQPNELLDRRGQLVKELVEATGAGVVENADGTLNVELTGQTLVDGVTANAMTAGPDGGKLQGLIDVRDTVIPNQLTALDELAVALIEEVNAIHTGGFDLDGAAGLDLFTGTGASDLALNAAITDNPRLIAAADTDGGGAGAPGDGDNALELAGLADQRLTSLGDNTIGGFYRQMSVDLGLIVQEADEQTEGQAAVVAFLENQRASIAGVSLDEEAVHLIESQRAYQAAARVVTSVDQMLDRLINGTGIVGR